MDEEREVSHEIEHLKTDEVELEQVLDKFDLDESLEAEFNTISSEFHQLEIAYQSLLNTRRFLKNA